MSGGGCAGRKKGRERKALTCGPGSPERDAAGARGRAVRGNKGEGAVGWAGELRRARVGRLGHVGSLGCGEKEGERRKERAGGKKKKEAGWAELVRE